MAIGDTFIDPETGVEFVIRWTPAKDAPSLLGEAHRGSSLTAIVSEQVQASSLRLAGRNRSTLSQTREDMAGWFTMRHTLIVLCIAMSACSHPLHSLADRIEQRPIGGKYVLPQRTTSACLDTLTKLQDAAMRMGVPILYEEPPHAHAYGATNGRLIWIDPELVPDACGHVEVLAHELGHILQPPALTERERQLFADGVSYLVVSRMCGYVPTARYVEALAVLKPDARILRLYRQEIETVVHALIGPPSQKGPATK